MDRPVYLLPEEKGDSHKASDQESDLQMEGKTGCKENYCWGADTFRNGYIRSEEI